MFVAASVIVAGLAIIAAGLWYGNLCNRSVAVERERIRKIKARNFHVR